MPAGVDKAEPNAWNMRATRRNGILGARPHASADAANNPAPTSNMRRGPYFVTMMPLTISEAPAMIVYKLMTHDNVDVLMVGKSSRMLGKATLVIDRARPDWDMHNALAKSTTHASRGTAFDVVGTTSTLC